MTSGQAQESRLPSKERINRAGNRLRAELSGREQLSAREIAAELGVLTTFRRAHSDPLRKVSANLRYYVGKYSTVEDVPVIMSQRLKRMPTILDKLLREPGMRLSRMEDIGGCRALFASTEEIMQAVEDIDSQKRWKIVRHRNYIADPKQTSGYRAYHLIVSKDRLRIEVQLRTLVQHQWAELIERVDRKTGAGLKEGRAPLELTEYYRLGSELLAANEAGQRAAPITLQRFRQLHLEDSGRRDGRDDERS